MTEDIDPAALEHLGRAFAKLLPNHREIITLARGDGLSYAEIGERLGLTPDQVEHRLANAVYALDRALHLQERPWWRFW